MFAFKMWLLLLVNWKLFEIVSRTRCAEKEFVRRPPKTALSAMSVGPCSSPCSFLILEVVHFFWIWYQKFVFFFASGWFMVFRLGPPCGMTVLYARLPASGRLSGFSCAGAHTTFALVTWVPLYSDIFLHLISVL